LNIIARLYCPTPPEGLGEVPLEVEYYSEAVFLLPYWGRPGGGPVAASRIFAFCPLPSAFPSIKQMQFS
jgi:hypothetical protein